MKYTTLGKTGLKISRMGFGGIPIQRIDAEGTKKLMKQLAEEGVNYIDTARGYTVSEEYLGYALEGIRDKFVIATKSMARTREAWQQTLRRALAIFEPITLTCIRYTTQAQNSWTLLQVRAELWRLFLRQREQVKLVISV